MLQHSLPPLLLYLVAAASWLAAQTGATFYESHPQCGYPASDTSGFVAFQSSPELRSDLSLGVCGYGLPLPGLRTRQDECLGCSFTPADRPSCPAGTALVNSTVWRLAGQETCTWQACWEGPTCISGRLLAETGICIDGTVKARCCDSKLYYRCCNKQLCTQRSRADGGCAMGEADLLAGQQASVTAYAVQAASTDCFQYSLDITRVCPENRTFGPMRYYPACSVLSPNYDINGCAKLPGYTFFAGSVFSTATEAVLDDGTLWDRFAANKVAVQAASANDMVLMASRCDSDMRCAAFDTLSSPTLRYYTPSIEHWVDPGQISYNSMSMLPGTCQGVYVKNEPNSICPRLDGYLFTSTYTPRLPANVSGRICADCLDTQLQWLRCEQDSDCTGWSTLSGTLRKGVYAPSASLAPDTQQPQLYQFTSTPCAGLYTRVAGLYAGDVVELDKLLCGSTVYCLSRIQYTARKVSFARLTSFTDIRVLLQGTDGSLRLPTRLTRYDPEMPALKQLPNVRSLRIDCVEGAVLGGGLPVMLAFVAPFLQELTISNCSVIGALPAEWAQLKYLRVLDLSGNQLSGPLPPAWSNLMLGYLNLSGNALAGSIPASWDNLISASVPMPPPPPPPNTSPPPPPPFPPSVNSSSLANSMLTAVSPLSRHEPLARGSLLMLDISRNQLGGEVPREYVHDSCLRESFRMVLQAEGPSGLSSAMRYVDGRGARTDSPLYLLYGNPGVSAWAGQYQFAAAKSAYSDVDHSRNLCGAYKFWIAIGIIWGLFVLAFLALLLRALWAWWQGTAPRWGARARGKGRGSRLSAKRAAGTAGIGAPADPSAAQELATDDADEDADPSGSKPSWLAGQIARLWSDASIRQLVFMFRMAYIAADVALDIRVTVWLFQDGAKSSAAVCAVFLGITHLVVALAVYATLAPIIFGSFVAVFGFMPVLVPLMPLLGPLMAFANLRKPDVPLVFWRYLELLEFCVALLQAPAQSVTQTIVYAEQNMMGGGMYVDHALFLASIIFSLGDMLIAVYKLLRYKRGPLQRLANAFLHLDKSRDIYAYRDARDFGVMDDGSIYDIAPGGNTALAMPLNSATMHDNPLHGLTYTTSTNGVASSHHEFAHLADSRRSPDGSLDHSQQQQHQQGGNGDGDASSGASPSSSNPLAGVHTFTHLTAPRYRSLLAQSAMRVGGQSLLMQTLPSLSLTQQQQGPGGVPRPRQGNGSGAGSSGQADAAGAGAGFYSAAAIAAAAAAEEERLKPQPRVQSTAASVSAATAATISAVAAAAVGGAARRGFTSVSSPAPASPAHGQGHGEDANSMEAGTSTSGGYAGSGGGMRSLARASRSVPEPLQSGVDEELAGQVGALLGAISSDVESTGPSMSSPTTSSAAAAAAAGRGAAAATGSSSGSGQWPSLQLTTPASPSAADARGLAARSQSGSGAGLGPGSAAAAAAAAGSGAFSPRRRGVPMSHGGAWQPLTITVPPSPMGSTDPQSSSITFIGTVGTAGASSVGSGGPHGSGAMQIQMPMSAPAQAAPHVAGSNAWSSSASKTAEAQRGPALQSSRSMLLPASPIHPLRASRLRRVSLATPSGQKDAATSKQQQQHQQQQGPGGFSPAMHNGSPSTPSTSYQNQQPPHQQQRSSHAGHWSDGSSGTENESQVGGSSRLPASLPEGSPDVSPRLELTSEELLHALPQQASSALSEAVQLPEVQAGPAKDTPVMTVTKHDKPTGPPQLRPGGS